MLALVCLVIALGTLWGVCARAVRRRDRGSSELEARFDALSPKPDRDAWARW